jgi:hypothetical protein
MDPQVAQRSRYAVYAKVPADAGRPQCPPRSGPGHRAALGGHSLFTPRAGPRTGDNAGIGRREGSADGPPDDPDGGWTQLAANRIVRVVNTERRGRLTVKWHTRMPPARPDAEYGIGPYRGGDPCYVAWLTGEGEMTLLPVASGRVPRRREGGEPLTDPAATALARAAIDEYDRLKPDPGKDRLLVVAQERHVTVEPLFTDWVRYTLTGALGGPVLYYADQGRDDWWPKVESAGSGEILYEPGAAAYDPYAGGDTEVAARVHAAIGRHLYRGQAGRPGRALWAQTRSSAR